MMYGNYFEIKRFEKLIKCFVQIQCTSSVSDV